MINPQVKPQVKPLQVETAITAGKLFWYAMTLSVLAVSLRRTPKEKEKRKEQIKKLKTKQKENKVSYADAVSDLFGAVGDTIDATGNVVTTVGKGINSLLTKEGYYVGYGKETKWIWEPFTWEKQYIEPGPIKTVKHEYSKCKMAGYRARGGSARRYRVPVVGYDRVQDGKVVHIKPYDRSCPGKA